MKNTMLKIAWYMVGFMWCIEAGLGFLFMYASLATLIVSVPATYLTVKAWKLIENKIEW